VSADAMASVVKAGGKAATSSAAAVKGAENVVTMLPSSPHVKKVYETEVFSAATKNALFMDCSTIDPNVAREVSAAAISNGFRMVDAPVSGGVGGAEAGTLTFMVGGGKDSFSAASAILQAMGKKIVHCGDTGAGQVAKICNNLILGISMNAVSEAMNLG
jgi:3-hydroxyisobutyrate dehydrogenase